MCLLHSRKHEEKRGPGLTGVVAWLWLTIAWSAMYWIGRMDALYNLEHGKYASLDARMILEMLINLTSFSSP